MKINADFPCTPLEFTTYLSNQEEIALDAVLYASREVPGVGEVRFYGIVDSADFASSYNAHVRITRILPETFIPPKGSIPVVVANPEQVALALHFDTMPQKVPAGTLASGLPAYFNLEFLNGEKGGHANIAGISGVATKTSYALFLLYSLFHTHGDCRGLIFNVKSSDLLHLDKPNARLTQADREHYQRMGLPCTPFQNVAFHGVDRGLWTLRQFIDYGLLRYFFNDLDQADTIDLAVDRLIDMLRQCAAGSPDRQLLVEGKSLETLEEVCRFLCAEAEDTKSPWWDSVAASTRRAVSARLKGISAQVKSLITPDGCFHMDKQLTVVDLHRLTDKAKSFVVGSVLQLLFDERENAKVPPPTTYIVLDELNKYAPAKTEGPIRAMLLDVAERGRSLGIILIGAQQTASEVEPRVVSNCSLRISGRLENSEAEQPCYGWLRGELRQRATLIQPGTMLLSQPQVPVPLVIRFPFPAWATRQSEVATTP